MKNVRVLVHEMGKSKTTEGRIVKQIGRRPYYTWGLIYGLGCFKPLSHITPHAPMISAVHFLVEMLEDPKIFENVPRNSLFLCDLSIVSYSRAWRRLGLVELNCNLLK